MNSNSGKKQELSKSLKDRLRRLRGKRTTPHSNAASLRKLKAEDKLPGTSSSLKKQLFPSTSSPLANSEEEDNPEINYDEEKKNITDTDNLETLQKCHKSASVRLANKKEKLRKLQLVKMYRSKNDPEQLECLIDKWRSVTQEAIEDLRCKMGDPKPGLKEFIQKLGVDEKLLKFCAEDESFIV